MQKSPVIAVLMLIFLLSLAGIPPTAGFLGKYYIFLSLIQTGHYVLPVIATLYVAVAIYYYFKIVRSMFVRETAEPSPLASSFGLGVALGVSGVLTLEALESIPSRFCAWRKRRWCDEDAMNEIFSHPWFVPIATTLVIIGLFPLVGYIVLVERKILADFQVRLGPMCVGPHGLLQPIVDALKLLIKEDIVPADADQPFSGWRR